MTENEVRKYIEELREKARLFGKSGYATAGMEKAFNKSADTIENLLNELESYRTIGTIEEFKVLKEEVELYRNLDKTNFSDGYSRAIDEFAERLCAACCENTFSSTINGIKNVEMMTLDGVTETIFEVAEQMKGGAT